MRGLGHSWPTIICFFTYSRQDDTPRGDAATGWVTAFHDHLRARHRRYSGRPLNVFFDRESIGSDLRWQAEILKGLRASRLFLAFLSPDYLASKYCRWEWEEYLRLEHTLARGEAGIKQVYFVRVPELEGGSPDDPDIEAWLADMRARNRHHSIDLCDWFEGGADALLRLDAADRLDDLRAHPQADADPRLIDLAERIATLDRSIAERLDEAVLAELARGNIPRSYTGFVGRAQELRDLHKALLADKVGMIGALHGLGGQGKTALAVQYAYAYAGHYAAGGRWQLRCEGVDSLAGALGPLSGLIGFEMPEAPKGLTPEAAEAHVVERIVAILRRYTHERVAEIVAARNARDDLHGPAIDAEDVPRRMLLILDNVDRPGLLSAEALAPLAAEDWLRVVVTTRLDPREVADPRAIAPVAVDDLPEADAMALLRQWRIFADEAEERAAREIVRRLGGFTLAVELVGAYLARKPSFSYARMLQRLDGHGLTAADSLAETVAPSIRAEARARTVGLITDATLETLTEGARTTLEAAAFMPPDLVRTDWLRLVVAALHPELSEDRVGPGDEDPWTEGVLDMLEGRRLLVPDAAESAAGRPAARLHRMIGEHIRARMAEERQAKILELVIQLTEAVGRWFQGSVRHSPGTLAHLPALVGLAETLTALGVVDPRVTRALGVCGYAEMTHGEFQRAGALHERHAKLAQTYFDANPDSAEARRDLSVSQTKLGDFYLRRGAAGDAERAEAMYTASLETRKALVDANPESAQARRDLSVL